MLNKKEERDKWYYNMCVAVSKNSKCLSRKIGAILVRDKSILSTGYNGPPRGDKFGLCSDRWVFDPNLYDNFETPKGEDLKKCPRKVLGLESGSGLEFCIAGHAERNTLINAARHGVCTKGTKLYMSCPVPCSPCLIEIINAGIEEIIFTKLEFYDMMAQYLLEKSDLKYRTYLGGYGGGY